MRAITKITSGRALAAPIHGAQSAIIDAIEMAMEAVEATIAEVRAKDNAVEWRSACDEILDRIRREY